MQVSGKIISILLIIAIIIISGCSGPASQNEGQNKEGQKDTDTGVKPLPPDAKFLFVSNKDTGSYSKEIFSMDASGGNVTRITNTGMHHFIFGIDSTKQFLVATRAVMDTSQPAGLGDEDSKSLWVIDLNTGEEIRLTSQDDVAEGDSFSPDGEWIVFFMVKKGSGQSDIYKIRKDGSDLTRLTYTETASEADPCWSADGKEIAFISIDPNMRFVLKKMDADGNNIKTIYDPVDSVSTSRFPPGAYDPSWSPDGQWIVFEKPVRFNNENGEAGVWHIFKIRPDGSSLVDLSESGCHGDNAEYLPSFSPDGKTIVFTARTGPVDASKVQVDIYTMEENGGSLKRITEGPAIEESAIWV